MTRDESLQIVAMILHHWRPKQQWSKEEIDAYAKSIQDMPADLATSAVAQAAKEIAYSPSIAELREYVRLERVRRAPIVAPPQIKQKPIPLWVKRWICARMLYDKFGKERDMRRFAEQGDHGDLTQELMPDDAWLDEANALDDQGASKAFARFVQGRPS